MTENTESKTTPPAGPARHCAPQTSRSQLITAIVLFMVAGGMVGMAFAAVPLYRIFCQVTGYGGTTQRAERTIGADKILDRTVTVRFDTTVSPKLPWRFEPVQRRIKVRIGENSLATFRAVNLSDKPLTGTASFNVTPEAAGPYFVKIQCFCFTSQHLEPGQSAELPVSFYVDPEFVNDPDSREINEITLSYTFFKSADKKDEVPGYQKYLSEKGKAATTGNSAAPAVKGAKTRPASTEASKRKLSQHDNVTGPGT